MLTSSVFVSLTCSPQLHRAPAAGAACQPVPAVSTSFVVESAVMCEVEVPPNGRFAGTVSVTRVASFAANLCWRRAGCSECGLLGVEDIDEAQGPSCGPQEQNLDETQVLVEPIDQPEVLFDDEKLSNQVVIEFGELAASARVLIKRADTRIHFIIDGLRV